MAMDEFAARLQTLWSEALVIWRAGGWVMPGIAVTAFAMFGLGLHVQLRLAAKGFLTLPERKWRVWIEKPEARRGPIGELLDFVGGQRSLGDLAAAFAEVRTTELAPFERDLRVMKVCIAAAPLLGLLGTVTGMLATFQALAGGTGGEQTMGMVAKGISEALITTEAGLVVALPGVFFSHQLARKQERYRAFLAHVETVCTQKLHRDLSAAPAAAAA